MAPQVRKTRRPLRPWYGTLRFAAVAALTLALGAPAAAEASGSIAFVKDDNIWLTTPDGARQRQVTKDGTASRAYSWPSQADDGTILARYDGLFVRLRTDGTRLGDPVPALGSDAQHSGNVVVMAGPADPRISPDGTRFAYWVSVRGMVTCPVWDPGCSYQDTDYTIVSRVDRFTEPAEFGAVRDYRDPSWIGGDRLLVFNHGLGVMQGAISPVGAGEAGLLQWFDPPSGVPQINGGVMSRQGDRLAVLAGNSTFDPAQELLLLYGVSAPHPTPPEPKCVINGAAPPSGKFMQPSWSPEGTELAVLESDGIHVFSNIPDLRSASPNCAQIADRLLVYGSSPAWGPAEVPAEPPPPPPPATPVAAPPAPPATLTRLTVARNQRGRVVRVRVGVGVAGSRVRVRLTNSRRQSMGAVLKRAGRAGTLTLKVPLNKRGRAALRRSKRIKLTVAVSVTPPGGKPAGAVRRITLRR